jgi:hypothetical protein
MVPLGYNVSDRKVVVIEEEAERVQTIFRRYLKVGGLNPLMEELRERKILTKVRTLSTGRTVGGIAFTRGSLGHLLRNRFYVGEIEYKGEILPGEQPPILDRELFEAVQRKLDEQRNTRLKTRGTSEALLTGRIYDDAGHRMTPSVARKAGARYRYYVSSALVQGRGKLAGTVPRVSAPEIEALLLEAVRQHIQGATSFGDQELLRNHIDRVDVGADQLTVTLTKSADQGADASGDVLKVAWKKAGMKRERQILLPASAMDRRPIRSETRTGLVCAIARGRRWLDELVTGTVSDVETIAARETCSVRYVNMTISLAFLAPSLVSAAIEGRLPRGIGIARLRDAPAEWSRQYGMLGLSYPPAVEAVATRYRLAQRPTEPPTKPL